METGTYSLILLIVILILVLVGLYFTYQLWDKGAKSDGAGLRTCSYMSKVPNGMTGCMVKKTGK